MDIFSWLLNGRQPFPYRIMEGWRVSRSETCLRLIPSEPFHHEEMPCN